MKDAMLTPVEVGEWINENPETVIEWGEQGTDLFPYPIRQRDGTLKWKRSHVQTWLESTENQNVGFIQHPEEREAEETFRPPSLNRVVGRDEGKPTET